MKKLLPNNEKNARPVEVAKFYKKRGRIYFLLKNRADGKILELELDTILEEVAAYGSSNVILPNRDGSPRRRLLKR